MKQLYKRNHGPRWFPRYILPNTQGNNYPKVIQNIQKYRKSGNYPQIHFFKSGPSLIENKPGLYNNGKNSPFSLMKHRCKNLNKILANQIYIDKLETFSGMKVVVILENW